jgi:hypothetical protein
MHSRHIAELAYGEQITEALPKDEFLGELIVDRREADLLPDGDARTVP